MSDRAVDATTLHERLGVDGRTAALLADYVALLLRWNRRINLTAARTADAIIDEHLADCVACLPHLPAGPHRLLDVGAGGGFPGIVIAAARPDLEITMLEPVHKKQAFLATAIRELPLANARALAQRLEDHLASPDVQPYDLACSRATWALPDWLARANNAVRRGGLVLGFEGRDQAALPPGAERHVYPRGSRTRAVIVHSSTGPDRE